MGYQVNTKSLSVGYRLSDQTESLSSGMGKSSCSLSEIISDGVVLLKVNGSRLHGGEANLPLFPLVWMERLDPVCPCSPQG